MGEVSRTRADPRNSKYRESCRIERLIGSWPTLINSESVEKIQEKRVQVDKKLENTNEFSSIKNDGLADSQSISGFRHEGPLSKNPPKFHQNHIPCTLLHGCRADEATAEDSSYDSDEDSTSSTHSQPVLGHPGVSRTVSDTLAAEFADYVTLQPPALCTHPGYSSRVEFALKLGYTERLVQTALFKLGPEPGQDELLAELIRLGASPKSLDEDPTQELVAEDAPTPGVFLRPVVIDGSNVAMSHGNKELFSCRGIKLCVDWFRARGHREITVFVPKWRKESSRPDKPIADQEILGELERDRLLVFTPSRLINGKRLVCYDDRYILRLAVEVDGIVVSNDNYRDLAQESPEFRRVIEERILMYSFVNDRFMPPDDPLGRGGPTLDNFLRVSPRRGANLPCPYAKKCTYGNKCKFRHPERGETPQKSVTEQLVEHAQRHLRARGPSLSLPLPTTQKTGHRPLCRTQSASLPQKPIAGPDEAANRAYGYQQFGWQENAHKKLQRQLTLNPNCDLRLYQLRRQHYYPQGSQHQVKNDSNNNKSCLYEGDPAGGRNYQTHRHVTRISSAPDSSVNWTPLPAPTLSPRHSDLRLGVSDPQLNLVPYPVAINPAQDTQIYAARQRLHYHLAHIFPGEHVQMAMALHPHETDPQQICATILAMFPKH